MSSEAILIPPGPTFWAEVADALHRRWPDAASNGVRPRIVVPTAMHGACLRAALRAQPHIDGADAWPVVTPAAWWGGPEGATDGQRLMTLYGALRQHAWLKKLFAARRNTDLLPLAQTLLQLFDELTQALLPGMRLEPEATQERWQGALAQLSPAAHALLSDETQLVWSLWKSQLDDADTQAVRFARMTAIAQGADAPLAWITPIEPDAFTRAFLDTYAERQPVLSILLDWRPGAIDAVYANVWREILDAGQDTAGPIQTPPTLSLHAADSLEQEALHGAQTVIDWLQSGKSRIAIVAQDRTTARRIRALLERARVFVADETGWKLSTTRAAAALDAWHEAVASQGDTMALLDLLKSPFLLPQWADKTDCVMRIETVLRAANVIGGWDAIATALQPHHDESRLQHLIAGQARLFAGRKSLADWLALTGAMMEALGMDTALQADQAGAQVFDLLRAIEQDCAGLAQDFSFAEWRIFIGLQLESAPFLSSERDRRVAMLPLNGARLRRFDAVLLVGADADHLPSQAEPTLFFANAVRRELGLATRESRQRQQLRDFAELLCTSGEIVLSWQAHKNGEPNALSPWIERLRLTLARTGAAPLPQHAAPVAIRRLVTHAAVMPAPSAPQLAPRKLSASGYNNFAACPYQFFAARMLGLSAPDALADMPEKRDYGDWLHQILATYHEVLRERPLPAEQREALLREISDRVFGPALEQSGAALGYYTRWQKALPAYLAWAEQREQQGWHFALAEQWMERALDWPEGGVLLHGRIDRIDRNDNGEQAVLDYKTKPQQALRDNLKQREDHQLAFYGLLGETACDAAAYVALEPLKGKIAAIEAPQYAQWQHALERRIVHDMRALAHGAPLPATGVETVCQYCDMRGLCRKGTWQ